MSSTKYTLSYEADVYIHDNGGLITHESGDRVALSREELTKLLDAMRQHPEAYPQLAPKPAEPQSFQPGDRVRVKHFDMDEFELYGGDMKGEQGREFTVDCIDADGDAELDSGYYFHPQHLELVSAARPLATPAEQESENTSEVASAGSATEPPAESAEPLSSLGGRIQLARLRKLNAEADLAEALAEQVREQRVGQHSWNLGASS